MTSETSRPKTLDNGAAEDHARYRVPAVEKAITILAALARHKQGLGITELHTTLRLPKASVFMILMTLEQHRLIQKTGTGRYVVGVRLFELGSSFLEHLDIVEIARPHLVHLMGSTGLTTHLAILDDGEVLIVSKHEPNSFIRFSTFPGSRNPIHTSSLGKAMAAYLPEIEVERMLERQGMARYTPNTITSLDGFKQTLELVRQNGYSLEEEEEELNIGCIGAPIVGSEGSIAGAISITGLMSQLPASLIPTLAQEVRMCAANISIELGARAASPLGLLDGATRDVPSRS
jgi:DNA-binding IclR family transcriptional regulator